MKVHYFQLFVLVLANSESQDNCGFKLDHPLERERQSPSCCSLSAWGGQSSSTSEIPEAEVFSSFSALHGAEIFETTLPMPQIQALFPRQMHLRHLRNTS